MIQDSSDPSLGSLRGIAAAWRHWQLGHVVDPQNVAFPLAAGASR